MARDVEEDEEEDEEDSDTYVWSWLRNSWYDVLDITTSPCLGSYDIGVGHNLSTNVFISLFISVLEPGNSKLNVCSVRKADVVDAVENTNRAEVACVFDMRNVCEFGSTYTTQGAAFLGVCC